MFHLPAQCVIRFRNIRSCWINDLIMSDSYLLSQPLISIYLSISVHLSLILTASDAIRMGLAPPRERKKKPSIKCLYCFLDKEKETRRCWWCDKIYYLTEAQFLILVLNQWSRHDVEGHFEGKRAGKNIKSLDRKLLYNESFISRCCLRLEINLWKKCFDSVDTLRSWWFRWRAWLLGVLGCWSACLASRRAWRSVSEHAW